MPFRENARIAYLEDIAGYASELIEIIELLAARHRGNYRRQDWREVERARAIRAELLAHTKELRRDSYSHQSRL